MTTNSTLDAALQWLNIGISIIPIAYRSKLPDSNALKWTGYIDNGRASWTHFQDFLPTEQEIRLWTSGPRINLAVVTNWQNLVILDFDTLDAWQMYRCWLEDNELAQLVVDATYKVSTGRGIHVYLSIEEQVKNGHVGVIDIKAGGGYVLTPPSIHPTGRAYTAFNPCAPVCCVERLADVFPFEPEENASLGNGEVLLSATERSNDPFESADRVGSTGIIASIQAAYRIENFFTHLVSTGRGWYLTHCPLHDDSSPSFWIDTEKQLCGCYSGCTARPMDVINFYARMRGISNNEAIKELAKRL